MGIDPISLTMLGLSVAGGIGGAVSSMNAGDEQASQYQQEAALAQRQAQDVDLQSKQMSAARRTDLQSGLSAIAARRAAAGVGLDSPSAQAIERTFTSQSQNNENIDKVGYNNQEYSLMTQAAMRQQAAGAAKSAGMFNGIMGLVKTAGNVVGSGVLGGGPRRYDTDGLY